MLKPNTASKISELSGIRVVSLGYARKWRRDDYPVEHLEAQTCLTLYISLISVLFRICASWLVLVDASGPRQHVSAGQSHKRGEKDYRWVGNVHEPYP